MKEEARIRTIVVPGPAVGMASFTIPSPEATGEWLRLVTSGAPMPYGGKGKGGWYLPGPDVTVKEAAAGLEAVATDNEAGDGLCWAKRIAGDGPSVWLTVSLD